MNHEDWVRQELRKLSKSLGFRYTPLDATMERYNPRTLQPGFNTMPDGEEIFYIENPALGLWSYRGRFLE